MIDVKYIEQSMHQTKKLERTKKPRFKFAKSMCCIFQSKIYLLVHNLVAIRTSILLLLNSYQSTVYQVAQVSPGTDQCQSLDNAVSVVSRKQENQITHVEIAHAPNTTNTLYTSEENRLLV